MTNEIILFYDELKQKDTKRRTLRSELTGRQQELINRGLIHYIIKEVKGYFNGKTIDVLNVGGDLGIDLILMRENGIDIRRGESVDLFLPEDTVDFPKFYCGSVYNLTEILNDTKYDLIVFREVIEHLFDPDRAINSIKNVMTNHGAIIITTPNLSSLINRLLLLFGFSPMSYEVSTKIVFGKPRKFNLREGAAGHIRLFTYKSIKEFLDYYGFIIIRMYTIPAPPSNEISLRSPVILFERFLHKISKKLCSQITVLHNYP